MSMTRAEAEARGWKIWSSARTPRWHGDDGRGEWWYGEISRPLHREMAPTLEDLLQMIAAYEIHRASRELSAPTVPTRERIPQ